MIEFEWSESKALHNRGKHGVSFQEASEVFADDYAAYVADPDHSQGEHRYLLFGKSTTGNHLVVSFTDRGDSIRIISARRMTRSERRAYEE